MTTRAAPPSENGPALEVEGLWKAFASAGGERRALDGLSMSASAGDVLGVLGPNGAGKTTFLKILCGLLTPDAGRVLVTGLDVGVSAPEIQRRAGFAPAEDRSFYGRLSGLENLRFFAGLRGLGASELRARLEELEEPLGLGEIASVEFQRMSSGMRQRLALARALAHRPEVLLLDEPSRGLDPGGAQRLRDLVRRDFAGRPGRLVVWSTNRVEEAFEVSSRVLVLSGGRCAAQGPPAEVLRAAGAATPAEAYRRLVSEKSTGGASSPEGPGKGPPPSISPSEGGPSSGAAAGPGP